MYIEKMKRIYAFDFIRGIAVVLLIILHTGLHEWTSSAALESGSQESDPIINIMVFFVTQASVFHTIFGTVNGFMIYSRVSSGRNTPKQLFLAGIIMAICLIFWNYLFRLLFSADSGILYFLIGTGEIHVPEPHWLISSSTLLMVGLNSIIIPGVLALLFMKNNHSKARRNYWILGALGLLVLVLTPFMRDWFARDVETLMEQGKFISAAFLGAVVFDNFPIFPYAGFALMGSILGIALARNESRGKILLYVGIQGVFWFVIGMIGLQTLGGIDPSTIDLNTTEALLEDTYRQYGQLGISFLYFLLALCLFDYISPTTQARRTKYFPWLRRFGMISATVYVFESLLAATFRHLLNAIPWFGGWNESMGGVIFYGLFLACVWGLITYFWEKINYKFSLEWGLIQIIKIGSGKQSDKYDLTRLKSVE